MATSSSSSNSPCAACKFLRRKCMPGCIFAPYFPPEEPQKFANVHKVFGASNVTKLLNELLPHQREDAVNSLAYEAEARMKDPVYGCVGAISVLQGQVHRLQKELEAANADLLRYACGEIPTAMSMPPPLPPQVSSSSSLMVVHNPPSSMGGRIHQFGGGGGGGRRVGSNGGSGHYYQASSLLSSPYTPPWSNSSQSGGDLDEVEGGGERSL